MSLPEALGEGLKGFGNIGKSGVGFVGKILSMAEAIADSGARQISRGINVGEKIFAKHPLISTITAAVLFWKPMKNTFKKMTGMQDKEAGYIPGGIPTPRNTSPYAAGKAGPRDGMSEDYWRKYLEETTGRRPTV